MPLIAVQLLMSLSLQSACLVCMRESARWLLQEFNHERARLRCSPRVEWALEQWWTVAHASPLSSSGGSKRVGAIGQKRYTELFIRIYKALVADFQYEQAESSVLADWERDAVDGKVGKVEFFDGLFELAGAWAQKADVEEYVYFLVQLLARVSDRQSRTALLPLEQVEYSAYGLALGDGGVPR